MKNKPIKAIIIAAAIVAALTACSPHVDSADMPYGGLSSTTVPAPVTPQIPQSKEEAPVPEKPDRPHEILADMSIDEKIGQIFLAHYNAETAEQYATKYGFGGYILFAGDFETETKEAMTEKLRAVQAASKIKMLLGVDEEGGYINRVSSNSQYRDAPFPSPQKLYANGGWDAIISDTHDKSMFLKSIGLNLNLAPVCDVSSSRADYIHYRTLGQDAETTAQYAELVVTAMKAEKIGGTLKHFPGYGNNRDTHDGMEYDNRDYETFLTSEFLPFIAGIKAGAGCVLVSHNVVKCMDADMPASLSPAVHKILREELDFSGVIMTDDLYMGAVQSFTGGKGAAIKAILAGNDMLCCANAEEEFENVKAALADGTITVERLDESVLRILKWKLELGIIEK